MFLLTFAKWLRLGDSGGAAMDSYEARFAGVGRLFGTEGVARLRASHVCVVGVGGVGSWAVEALARSGVGELTLVDSDDVCISNVNRQLHAMTGQFDQPKVEVLARRVLAINPECRVHPIRAFFTHATADRILEGRPDYVLDAIDSPAQKCLLVARCVQRQIPVLVAGAAGGRRDPTALEVTDLAQSSRDLVLRAVRQQLRSEYGFPPASQPMNVECVYSLEPPVYPQTDGSVRAQRDPNADPRLDCQGGYGTATFVTGAFGFAAAARIVQRLTERPAGRTGTAGGNAGMAAG